MKRSSARNLAKAARLYRHRKYTQVITFLEPQVFLYRESYRYYYLLGMSCLYTGDYAGAFSYLQRALDIDERPEAMLGLGAVLLRRRHMDQAIRNYLDILDLDNHNRRAQRALQWLRAIESPDEVLEWFENRQIRKILPPAGWYIPSWIAVGTGAVVAAVVVTVIVRLTILPAFSFNRELRPGSELVALTHPSEPLVETEGSYRYEFTAREVERLFSEVGEYFNAGRDNIVRRELNRIAASNAGTAIKGRAELLRDYLTVPDFSNFQDGFSYREVVAEPVLHDQVYVRWRGRIANLVVDEDRIRFDLLVGYHTGQVVEGIVPVEIDFAVVLNNNNPVEVIGLVRTAPDGVSALRGTSIRLLSQREMN